MAENGGDTKSKTEKSMTKKNVGLKNKNEKSLKEKDDGLKKKNEKSMKEKDDHASKKSKNAMTKKDDGTKEKTEKSMTKKDDGLKYETGKSITEKADGSINKNEKAMTEEDCGTLDESKKAENGGKKYNEEKTTVSNLKECFRSVKVSKQDATKVQRGLEGEIFNTFSEKCEVMNATKISFEKLNDYLDHLQREYEGIDDDVRTNMNSALFEEKSWESKMVEWKFKRPNNSGIIYGLLAFGRSKDQEYVDSVCVSYKMDFQVTPYEIVTAEQHTWLGGLYKYTTQKVESIEKNQDTNLIQNMQNFFRVKALERIFNEGFIESINFVDSKDETPDSKCD